MEFLFARIAFPAVPLRITAMVCLVMCGVSVPAARAVDIGRLGTQLNRDLELATEAEIDDLFPDCDHGALPPLGMPYQIPTVYDDSLAGLSDVYFEAGDHDDVVHMSGDAYLDLLSDSRHGRFSCQLSGGSGRA